MAAKGVSEDAAYESRLARLRRADVISSALSEMTISTARTMHLSFDFALRSHYDEGFQAEGQVTLCQDGSAAAVLAAMEDAQIAMEEEVSHRYAIIGFFGSKLTVVQARTSQVTHTGSSRTLSMPADDDGSSNIVGATITVMFKCLRSGISGYATPVMSLLPCRSSPRM